MEENPRNAAYQADRIVTMKKTKRTAHLSIHFTDMDVVNTDEAIDTIKSVLIELESKMHEEVTRALEDIGARDVELSIMVY